jgi:hypothetical protein
MKKHFILSILFILSLCFRAQMQPLTSPPPGGNKKAGISERIGITDVSLHYDRPGVKGREGKIYGTPVVHEGFDDLGFNNGKVSPWRAGANENTTIEFSTNVKVEGKDLAAGIYGLFIAYGKDESTIIFSKNSTSWGSFFYNENEDALRVKVKNGKLEKSVEWMRFEFNDQTENSATITMEWEKVFIPFKVEVDLVQTTLAKYRLELRTDKHWNWEAFLQAAGFCDDHSANLNEGLDWANTAVSYNKNFQTLKTKANLLNKLGRSSGADSAMKTALPLGNMTDLHFYGKELLSQKKNVQALEVFKMNAQKNPKQFTTYAGLTRGYSANGDYKNALTNAKLGLALAPNEPNKKAMQEMIAKLEKGQDVN